MPSHSLLLITQTRKKTLIHLLPSGKWYVAFARGSYNFVVMSLPRFLCQIYYCNKEACVPDTATTWQDEHTCDSIVIRDVHSLSMIIP